MHVEVHVVEKRIEKRNEQKKTCNKLFESSSHLHQEITFMNFVIVL